MPSHDTTTTPGGAPRRAAGPRDTSIPSPRVAPGAAATVLPVAAGTGDTAALSPRQNSTAISVAVHTIDGPAGTALLAKQAAAVRRALEWFAAPPSLQEVDDDQ